jgi:hypothetical protein
MSAGYGGALRTSSLTTGQLSMDKHFGNLSGHREQGSQGDSSKDLPPWLCTYFCINSDDLQCVNDHYPSGGLRLEGDLNRAGIAKQISLGAISHGLGGTAALENHRAA